MAEKKKREKKCKPRGVDSKGVNGAGGRVRNLTPLQLMLMGKGPVAASATAMAARTSGSKRFWE